MPRHKGVDEALMRARGEALRRARGSMKREALAADLCISHQQLSKYERGENLVSAALAERVATILNCRIGDIFLTAAPSPDGATGVAEPPSAFVHDDGLAEILTLALDTLSGSARVALRRFAIELIDEPQAEARVAKASGVL